MALTQIMNKSNWSLIFLETKTWRKEEEKREEEEEEKKKREEEAKPKRYGTMTINMNTCFGLYGTALDKDFFN